MKWGVVAKKENAKSSCCQQEGKLASAAAEQKMKLESSELLTATQHPRWHQTASDFELQNGRWQCQDNQHAQMLPSPTGADDDDVTLPRCCRRKAVAWQGAVYIGPLVPVPGMQ
jgi:hypothetical protein